MFIVVRLLVVVCAIAVESFAPADPAGPGGSIRQATDRSVLASLTSWDAVYYLGIAQDGYQAGPVNGPYPEVVFLPMYPLTVRLAAGPLGGDLMLAGVVAANIAGFGAMLAVYALARRRLVPRSAMLATALVALQPGAVALSMAYSDGLFLLLTCSSLLAAEARMRPVAGLLAALAALTRPQGALLLVPLLILFAQQDGRRPRTSWTWALAAPFALGVFGLAMGRVTGDILAPITAQWAWELGVVPGAVAAPWVLVVAALVYGGTALLALVLLIHRWRRRPDRAGMAWAVVNVGAIVVARRLQSLPRYLLPVTSIAEQLASGGYRQRVVRGILSASIVGYVVFALLHFSLQLAP
jgi:4-amino-4-deoxy-L-arabinose transferase-like glycosyltransferase